MGLIANGRPPAVDDQLHPMRGTGAGRPRDFRRKRGHDLQAPCFPGPGAEGPGEATLAGTFTMYQDVDRDDAIEILTKLQQRLDEDFNRICSDYHAGRWSRDEGWTLRANRFRELRALQHALECLKSRDQTGR